MARYIPIGEPANRSEAESMRALRDNLPEHYIVLGNFELQLPNRANTFEYDAVVIGEHGIYAVEVKGWTGEIHGDPRCWYLDWGRVQNPLILTERKAKALRGFLSTVVQDLPGEVFCRAVVLLPANANIRIEGGRADQIVKPDRLYDFFVDEANILEFGPGHLLDESLRTRIERALLPLSSPATRTPRIAGYEIIGEYDDDDRPFREFVGRHLMIRSRNRVRIKKYVLDPLATPAERARQDERALRDMEALGFLESNPYVAGAYDLIRDQEDEDYFYVASEWVGSESLADLIERRRTQPPEARADVRPLCAHLLRAVQFMHERGIIHRNLTPRVIYLTNEGERVPLKITDFDYARIVQLPSIEGSFEEMGSEGYAAPELWRTDNYDHRVDVFSVGAIIFELLTGTRLYEVMTEMLDHDATWERRRHEVTPTACREVLDALLQSDPDRRPADLSESIEAVASCC